MEKGYLAQLAGQGKQLNITGDPFVVKRGNVPYFHDQGAGPKVEGNLIVADNPRGEQPAAPRVGFGSAVDRISQSPSRQNVPNLVEPIQQKRFALTETACLKCSL